MEPSANTRSNATGTVIAGHFRLLDDAGDDVQSAEDADGQRVDVRWLGTGEHDLERARAVMAVESPYLQPVIDVGRDPRSGRVFMILASHDHITLDAILKKEGPLVPSVALRIVCQAAHGLQAVNRSQLEHPGINPWNLRLAGDCARSRVVVAGLGASARAAVDPARYLAPERLIAGGRASEATDVWGLGMTLYAALAGDSPFAHLETLSEIQSAIVNNRIPVLQHVAPWIPARLAEIVHGFLLPRDARCPSLADLLSDLEARTGGGFGLRPQMIVGVTPEHRAHHAAPGRIPETWSPTASAREQPAAESDRLTGIIIGRRYKLVRLVGRGGRGAVYEAIDGDQRVAVKVISRDCEDGDAHTIDLPTLRRFIREARNAQRIDSPYVVKVMEVDNDAHLHSPYIVMELLTGHDLHATIRNGGALAPGAAARLFVDACEGLAAAHRQGIIHRDIKPGNIFLAREAGGRVRAKLCDFGIAKALPVHEGEASVLTQTGAILGSPRYMSPEHVRDPRTADERSDVWSMGAALYEALSGKPIWGNNRLLSDLLLEIRSRDVRSLAEHVPSLPRGLVETVHRALRRKPSERYQSAREFADALAVYADTDVHIDGLHAAPRPASSATTPAHDAQAAAAAPSSMEISRTETRPGLAGAGGAARAKRTVSRRRALVGIAIASCAGAVLLASIGVAATRYHVDVVVDPPTSHVFVDGIPQHLADNVLPLVGEPGQSFDVRIDADGVVASWVVVITREGRAVPPRLRASTPSSERRP